MIVFDLDGTILRSDHQTISDRTYEVLKSYADQGVPLAINTGRCAAMIPFEIFPPITYAITCNGACILDETGQVLHSVNYSADDLRVAWQVIRRHDIAMELFSNGGLYMEQRILRHLDDYEGILPGFHIDYLRRGAADAIEDYETAIAAGMEDITKINFPGKTILGHEDLRRELIDLDMFEIVSDGHNLELMTRGCSKWAGLDWLCKDQEIDPLGVVAFGDGDNDRPMLRNVRWSVAMGNAADEVKEETTYVVTASNDEDGVARFLTEFFG